jgi:hypothetical protein
MMQSKVATTAKRTTPGMPGMRVVHQDFLGNQLKISASLHDEN